MPLPLIAGAVTPWRNLRLGPFRFTLDGLAAATGLLGTMGLVRRCALRRSSRSSASEAKSYPEAAWDVGLFAIFSCFVSSRLLLVVQSPAAFRRSPLLLLSLPSLTPGGIVLAALCTGLYLYKRHLPLLTLLDTYSVPAVLLAGFLAMGQWATDSRAGMPTHVPWAAVVPEMGGAVRVHPVALYGAAAFFLLAGCLWQVLSGVSLGGLCSRPGTVAGLGAFAGGGASFLIDMLSAPPAYAAAAWLESRQWVALAVMAGGAGLWFLTLDKFIDGKPMRCAPSVNP